jgi:hypothetical protein
MHQSKVSIRLPVRVSVLTGAYLVVAISFSLAGCSSSTSLVPVSGVVTFDSGPPPASGTVIFKPERVSEGFANRSGRATFSSDGKFVVTSFQKGDGLAPGEYTVEVSCYHSAPKVGTKDPFGDASVIDKRYEPAKFVVDPGSDAMNVTFDVPLKKKT